MRDSPDLRPDTLSRILAPAILSAADAAGVGLTVVVSRGLKSHAIFANDHVASLLGYTPEALCAMPATELIAEDAREEILDALGRASQRPHVRTFARRKDGARVAVDLFVGEATVRGERVVVTFWRDVSADVDASSRLLERDRLASVGQLAAAVAHEINNPLTYVLLNLRLLQKAVARAVADPSQLGAVGPLVQSALEGTERIAATVRDLGMVAGTNDDTVRPIDVRAVLEAVARIAKTRLRGAVTLEMNLAEQLPFARGNEALCGQVALNLLLNASDAIARAGRPGTICLRAYADDAGVVVEVEDDGAGIAEADMPRLFDPFFTRKASGEGTGIGLTTASRIVRRFGGSLTAHHREGGGAVFRCRLPLATPAAPDAEQRRQSGTRARQRLKVLIVDDEAPVADSLAGMLADGYDVHVAYGGAAALEALAAHAFGAALIDLRMPPPDGPAVYRAICEHQPSLAANVVFMTGAETEAEAARFLRSVANKWVRKPFDSDSLEMILRVLDRGHDEAQAHEGGADGAASAPA